MMLRSMGVAVALVSPTDVGQEDLFCFGFSEL